VISQRTWRICAFYHVSLVFTVQCQLKFRSVLCFIITEYWQECNVYIIFIENSLNIWIYKIQIGSNKYSIWKIFWHFIIIFLKLLTFWRMEYIGNANMLYLNVIINIRFVRLLIQKNWKHLTLICISETKRH